MNQTRRTWYRVLSALQQAEANPITIGTLNDAASHLDQLHYRDMLDVLDRAGVSRDTLGELLIEEMIR